MAVQNYFDQQSPSHISVSLEKKKKLTILIKRTSPLCWREGTSTSVDLPTAGLDVAAVSNWHSFWEPWAALFLCLWVLQGLRGLQSLIVNTDIKDSFKQQ